MKTSYTRQEICSCIETLENFFDRVELVDATTCRKMDPHSLGYTEHCTFGKENSRCDFCVSAQCIAEHSRINRLRIADGRVFNTSCQYVEVEGRALALLLANDASEDFCPSSDGEGTDPALLADMSRMVERYNRWTYRDFITGVYNRRYLQQNYMPTLPALLAEGCPVNLALVRVNKLSVVHEQFGREAADRLVGYVANLFQQQISLDKPDGVVCRMANNCFVVSCEGHDRAYFEDCLRTVYKGCRKEFRASMSQCAPFTLTIVTASATEAPDGKALLELLDKRAVDAHNKQATGVVTD